MKHRTYSRSYSIRYAGRWAAAFGLIGMTFVVASPVSAASISDDDCVARSGYDGVSDAIAIGPDQRIQLEKQADGTYKGSGSIRVFCQGGPWAPDPADVGRDLGGIAGATVPIRASNKDLIADSPTFDQELSDGEFQIHWATRKTEVGHDVTLAPLQPPSDDQDDTRAGDDFGPFTDGNGDLTFTITSPTPDLDQRSNIAGTLRVGSHWESVLQAYCNADGTYCDGDFSDGGGPGTGGDLTATPELNSIGLFGSGAAGLAGYALMRVRAARRKRHDDY